MSRNTHPVRYWDYRRDYAAHREEYLRLCDAVFASGRLVLGERLADFEQRFAACCGTAGAIGVASGTDALFLALKGLGIGAGDEVLTVANTAVPTVAAIRAAGATPVFVDVEEETFLMDAQQLEAARSGRSRCLLPVHLCGQMADMPALTTFARLHGLAVVEDCAQACGATCQGRRAGSWGDVGAFSFYPTKVLGAFGDGGMLTADEPTLLARLRRLRFYGMEAGYHAEEEGYNSRLDELQAALLASRLERLAESVERRRQLAALYHEGLAGVGDLRLPVTRPEREHQFYLYTIRSEQRDALQAFLARQGVESKVNYPDPIHLMRGYRFLGYRPGSLPVTERLAGSILSLPLYPELRDDEAERVIAAVRRFFRGGSTP